MKVFNSWVWDFLTLSWSNIVAFTCENCVYIWHFMQMLWGKIFFHFCHVFSFSCLSTRLIWFDMLMKRACHFIWQVFIEKEYVCPSKSPFSNLGILDSFLICRAVHIRVIFVEFNQYTFNMFLNCESEL